MAAMSSVLFNHQQNLITCNSLPRFFFVAKPRAAQPVEFNQRGSHLDLSQKILQHVVEHVGILHLFPGKHRVSGLKTGFYTFPPTSSRRSILEAETMFAEMLTLCPCRWVSSPSLLMERRHSLLEGSELVRLAKTFSADEQKTTD